MTEIPRNDSDMMKNFRDEVRFVRDRKVNHSAIHDLETTLQNLRKSFDAMNSDVRRAVKSDLNRAFKRVERDLERALKSARRVEETKEPIIDMAPDMLEANPDVGLPDAPRPSDEVGDDEAKEAIAALAHCRPAEDTVV